MGIRSLNRWQAFAGHLGFSLLLGAAVFALFRFVWYPEALFALAGAGTLMLLVVGIDVTLGPLLTLIVFNPSKKSLVLDLSVILALQMAALGYGVWVMAQSRPVFLVAAVDRFELVSANELDLPIPTAALPQFRRLPWTGPALAGANPPSNQELKLEIALAAAAGGKDIDRRPEHYVPFESVRTAFLQRAAPLERFPQLREGFPIELRKDLLVIPVRARYGWGTVVVRSGDGQIMRYLDTDTQSITPH